MRATPLAFLAILALSSLAKADDSGDLAAKLASLAELSGRFEQQLENSAAASPGRSGGRFSLRRPDQFRWEITEPDSQLLIANRGVLWHYDRDLATATRRRFDDAAAAPLLLLAADAEALAEAFTVRALTPEHYRILPRDTAAGFREAELTFSDSLPVRMHLVDRLGQSIQIRFLELKQGTLPAGAFDFEPPAGVDVFLDSD